MKAELKPDGTVLLAIREHELIDVAYALTVGGIACGSIAERMATGDPDRPDIEQAAEWLEKLNAVLRAPSDPPRRPPPTLRLVK